MRSSSPSLIRQPGRRVVCSDGHAESEGGTVWSGPTVDSERAKGANRAQLVKHIRPVDLR